MIGLSAKIQRGTLPNPYEIRPVDIGETISEVHGEVVHSDVGKQIQVRRGEVIVEDTQDMIRRLQREGAERPPFPFTDPNRDYHAQAIREMIEVRGIVVVLEIVRYICLELGKGLKYSAADGSRQFYNIAERLSYALEEAKK